MKGGRVASILIVSDGHGPAENAGALLRQAGHLVMSCGGGPGPFSPCPLLRLGHCPLAESTDLIIFAFRAFPPAGRIYGGAELFRAYRFHPDFGAVPMVVAVEVPDESLEGRGPIAFLGSTFDPITIARAAMQLLASSREQPFGLQKKGRMALPTRSRTAEALGRK